MRLRLLLSTCLVAACSSPPPPPPVELARLSFPATVGVEGAIVSGLPGTELDGVELTIPAGALDAPVELDARVIAEEPALGPTGYAVGPTFLFTPEGRALATAATVKLPLYPSRVEDLEQTPAECRAWLRSDTTWSQVSQTASGPGHVEVSMSALGAAAAGAVLKLPTSTIAAGPACTSPSGFCVTALNDGLKETSTQYSNITGGKLYAWRARTTATGIAGVITEYDVTTGTLTRTSPELDIASSTQPRPFLSDAAQRVALAADGSVWVALGHGVAQVPFTGKGTFFPETATDTRTVAMAFTADGTRHRVRLTANKAGTSASLSLSSATGATEPSPVEFDTAMGAWKADQLPVLAVKDVLGYAFPLEKNRVALLSPPKSVMDLAVPTALTATERAANPPDELAFTTDGTVMALSLQKPDAMGRSLWVQSRDGSISRGIAGLGNLTALEFTGDGVLWAAPAGAAVVFRIDPATGATAKVPLTSAAFGTAEYKSRLPLALRSFTFPATGGSPERHVLFVITAGLVRTVVRVEPSAPMMNPDAGFPDAGLPDAGFPDAGSPDAGNCPVDTACIAYLAGTCAPMFTNNTCDDGNACTSASACSNGACVATASACVNGGTCPATGVCVCPAGTAGDLCQFDNDECATFPSPCGTGSTCTNTDGGYACACLPGLTSSNGDGGACATSGKALELMVFYDETIERLWGDQAPARIDELIRVTAATYESNAFSPSFKITLEAITPLSPMPAAITYRSCGTPDPAMPSCTGCWLGTPPIGCAGALSTQAGEIDHARLLNTFLQFVQTRRASLVRFDNALLLTTRDFPSSSIDLGFVGAVCTQNGGSVVQVLPNASTQTNAATITHALGHNLDMPHDSAAGFVMSAVQSIPPSTVFSTASLTVANAYLSGGSTACMNDGGAHAWATTRCRDGRIDPTEQCDPGALVDGCCSSTCQLVPGCSCQSSDPCCSSGAFVDAGVACRASDGPCDPGDVCDGVSSKCRDRLEAAGTSCPDGGLCFKGACQSRDALCLGFTGAGATGQCTSPTSTSCNGLSCSFGGSSCGTFAGQFDGVACGTGNQCASGACQPSTSLLTWRWRIGAFGACTNGLKRRTVVCENEAGATGADALCPQPKPEPALNCP